MVPRNLIYFFLKRNGIRTQIKILMSKVETIFRVKWLISLSSCKLPFEARNVGLFLSLRHVLPCLCMLSISNVLWLKKVHYIIKKTSLILIKRMKSCIIIINYPLREDITWVSSLRVSRKKNHMKASCLPLARWSIEH